MSQKVKHAAGQIEKLNTVTYWCNGHSFGIATVSSYHKHSLRFPVKRTEFILVARNLYKEQLLPPIWKALISRKD
ncbi:hypothetical protein BaRGS_00032675 [Batillaria attramentaria]|uniref:Uncharacterized protein n=1 Tax=Batillaria attramentaria TaxID=370345 RepID=A0ABD0JLY7_9CAEN